MRQIFNIHRRFAEVYVKHHLAIDRYVLADDG